jgi:hypothetical protein
MQLLAKAESTDADAEAVALVERSYRLLAEVITQHDLEQGETVFGLRRRERRLLRDRRAERRSRLSQAPGAQPAGVVPDPVVLVDLVARYRRSTEAADTGQRGIDLTM